MRILFPILSRSGRTGALYTDEVMIRALERKHEVKVISYDELFPVNGDLSLLIFGYMPMFLKPAYDLVITSGSYIFADLVYAQPPAGRDVVLPLKDNILLSENSSRYLAPLFSTLNLLIKNHSRFIANSKWGAYVVKRSFGKDAEVLYPPVPVHLYDWRRKERDNLVVTIAGLNPRKNLEIIPDICERVPDAHFILIGYYHEKYSYILDEIKRRLEEKGMGDRFTYIPTASVEEKKEYLERAKVYFHPTPYEPFGISIVEGMASGLIPVVHDSGGPKEYVPDEWRYKDVEEASRKIRKALSSWNLEVASDMAEIASDFGEEVFEERVLEIVEKYS